MRMFGGGRAALVAALIGGALGAAPSSECRLRRLEVRRGRVQPRRRDRRRRSARATRPSYFFRTGGGHPQFGITDFKFNTNGDFLGTPDGNVKDVHVDLPVGLSVNPEATPKCEDAQLGANACPAASRVGTNYITAISGSVQAPIPHHVYNMVQPDGMPARFGMNVPIVGGQIYLDGGVAWDGDYHESFDIKDITDAIPLVETRLVFDGRAGDGTFITMPSQCAGPQTTGLDVDSHQNPGVYLHYSTTTPVGAIGCDRLPFSPGVAVSSDTRRAGAPAGVTIDVTVPQNPNGKDQPNTATLKDAHVTLPAGMALNPSAATGLEACTDDQLGKGTKNPVTCPAASAIGTRRLRDAGAPGRDARQGHGLPRQAAQRRPDQRRRVPDLPGRRQPALRPVDPAGGTCRRRPQDRPADRVVRRQPAGPGVARARRAARRRPRDARQPADLRDDQRDGELHARGSGAQTATATAPYTVDQGCDAPFAPAFARGRQHARRPAPRRRSRRRSRAATATSRCRRSTCRCRPGCWPSPPASRCARTRNAAAGTCPAASRIGAVATTAGAGNDPFGLGGQVYLTGPVQRRALRAVDRRARGRGAVRPRAWSSSGRRSGWTATTRMSECSAIRCRRSWTASRSTCAR